jgi:hypothetical protein
LLKPASFFIIAGQQASKPLPRRQRFFYDSTY